MSRQGLMDDSGYDFFDVSDCANYESCREEAYNDGYSDAIDEFARAFIEEGKKIKYLRHLWIESTCKKIAEQLKEQ